MTGYNNRRDIEAMNKKMMMYLMECSTRNISIMIMASEI